MTHRVFIWRWQCKLTRWDFPENSLGHKILKALSIKRRTMYRDGILKSTTRRRTFKSHDKSFMLTTYTIVNDTLKRVL